MLMDSLLSNAVLATVLAVGVLAVTRYWRRPPVVYWLWLLVLLKLVTPAMLPLPILVSAESEPTQQAVAPLTLAEAEALLATLEDGAIGEVRGPADPLELSAPSKSPPVETGASDATSVVETPVVVEPVSGLLDWRSIVASVWIAGSLLWILVAVVRVVRFGRLATQALSAPEWIEREAQQIAERFGMRRCPPIRVVAARIPPLVWAIHARPIVLLPSPLLTELNSEQLSALLAHELAHVRRGDHWVRRLELVVLAIYWWHPVAWLARRRLEEAEEQCCDAWVTWGQPSATRGYADALVRTVEFLSGPPCPAPLGASGIGPVRSLERRIQMILNERTPRRLSWKSGLFVLAVSLLVLPWSARAQDQTDRDSPEAQQERSSEEAAERDRGDRDLESAQARRDRDRYEAVRTDRDRRPPEESALPRDAADDGRDPVPAQRRPRGPEDRAALDGVLGTGLREVNRDPRVSPNRDAQRQIKIYQLEEADAFNMQTLIQTLFEGTPMRVVSDARTNSVIVFASPSDIATIEALLQVLDAKVERPARRGATERASFLLGSVEPNERRAREGNNARNRARDVRSEPLEVEMLAEPEQRSLVIRGAAQEDAQQVAEMLGALNRAGSFNDTDAATTIRRLQEEIKQLKAQIEMLTEKDGTNDDGRLEPPSLSLFDDSSQPPAGDSASSNDPLDDLFGPAESR